MGLYNYIGKEGEQVKCFYVPCISVKRNPETGVASASFSTSGGQLVAYPKEVPYKTYYYNYGKNFLILDYRWVSSEPYVHIIQNGEYVETVNYKNVPQNVIIDNVIDNWGYFLNIHSAEEIIAFIDDYNKSEAVRKQLEETYFAEANMSIKLPSFSEMKDQSLEAVTAYFNKRNAIYDKVLQEAVVPFTSKWMLPDEPNETIIGLLLSDYEKRSETKNEYSNLYEYEWHVAFPDAIQYLKKMGIDAPLEKYFEWAAANNIELDKDYVRSLFEKYSQPCPKEFEDEWVNSTFNF